MKILRVLPQKILKSLCVNKRMVKIHATRINGLLKLLKGIKTNIGEVER